MTQPKTDLAYLRNEKAKAEQKLRSCQHREKILERQMSELNRRERVHRLCTRAGMLESFLVCPGELTDDQVIHFTGYDVKNILTYHGIPLDQHVFYSGTLPEYKMLFRKIIRELQQCKYGYEDYIASMFNTILLLVSRQHPEGNFLMMVHDFIFTDPFQGWHGVFLQSKNFKLRTKRTHCCSKQGKLVPTCDF